MEDGEDPIKLEIVKEGYLPEFLPGPKLCGIVRLKKEDLIATKLLTNFDKGLGAERNFRDFFDLIIACNK